jgi:hypothetical protein
MFGYALISIVAYLLTANLYSQVRPDAVATYPVLLHEQLTSSCALIQPVTLVQYKGYDALELADTTDEIYSPELEKGDFVSVSSALPKKATKFAQKSGFNVRPELTAVSGLSPSPLHMVVPAPICSRPSWMVTINAASDVSACKGVSINSELT